MGKKLESEKLDSLLLNAKQAQDLIGVSSNRFYELVKLPEFPKAKIMTGGKRPMYVRRELEEWVKNLPYY